MLCIRKLQVEDKSDIFNIIERNLRLSKKTSKSQLEWRYINSKFLANSTAYGAFTKNKALVSFYANVPHGLIHGQKKMKTSLCLDMTTDREYRRKGLVTQLASCVYREIDISDIPFNIGFSNKDGIKVDKNSTKYGYKIVGSFETFLFIGKTKSSTYLFEKIESLSSINVPSDKYQIDKNSKYLDWRYHNKDFQKYLYYKVKDQNKTIAEIVVKKTSTKIEVFDMHLKEGSDYSSILQSLPQLAQKLGRSITSITVLNNSFWSKVFIDSRYRRQPLSKQKYYLTVRTNLRLRSDQKDFLDKENWLLFSGDIL